MTNLDTLLQSLYGTGSNRKPVNKPHLESPDSLPGDRGGTPGVSPAGSGGGNSPDDPELCASNAKIDAIFTEAGTTYVFKGKSQCPSLVGLQVCALPNLWLSPHPTKIII